MTGRRSPGARLRSRLAPLGWTAAGLLLAATSAPAQEIGREALEELNFPPLRFDPPEPEEHRLESGVTVFHLHDPTLPLVNVYARFEGGYAHFGRDYYAAGSALPFLLRGGGTRTLPPDSVDDRLAFHAVQTTFGGDGESVTASFNALRDELDVALELWGAMLREPRFDSGRVEVWRGRRLESVRRRSDEPGRLAVSEFNRIMYGDHSVGWEMTPEDLELGDLVPERLRWLHRRVACPENLTLGIWGDVAWEEMEPRLDRLLDGWPPCREPLPERPAPRIRREPGVFLIPRELEQSTVVLAHVTDLHLGDTPEYFASRIANAVLGAGGFSSRLLSRLRTEEGYAYSASSLWTAPPRHDGVLGALTRTKSGSTVAAIRLIRGIMEEMTRTPPEPEEVETVVREFANGFVFNFETPGQIVERRLALRAQELPDDWLERYLRGIQAVTPRDVLRTFRRHARPDELVILVVGDPEGFDEPLDSLGEVRVLGPDGG